MSQVEEVARRARAASREMLRLSAEARNSALESLASLLKEQRPDIIAANDKDKAAAQAVGSTLPAALVKRLDVGGRKYDSMLEGLASVAAMKDPIGEVSLARELDDSLALYRVACPIGVICIIFEARPEAGVQIASLAIKSGNAVILKGGKEGEHSNRAIVDCIRQALREASCPVDAVQLVSTRDEVQELLNQDEHVDLIIPRGSNALVSHIKANTKIPVMGHADGLCSVYIDSAADPERAAAVVVDSKTQNTSVCNAAETLLVARDAVTTVLPTVAKALGAKKVQLRVDAEAKSALAAVEGLDLVDATAEDFDTEFLDLILAVKVVADVHEAADHINTHGSGHTDCIVTEDKAVAQEFLTAVDAGGVFHNASTRFADGFRYGFGAEVGVSTHRTHARGPVGLEGLMIYKYKLYGSGHTVSPYANGEKSFTHVDIDASTIPGR